jgi:tetratricopeptide (TPR) repeat protein
MDADDRLDRANNRKLKELFKNLPEKENVAFSMKCLCVPEGGADAGTVVDHVRLFRNRPDLRWKYRVHEQILGAVRQSGGQVVFTDIVIQHVGYLDPAQRVRKRERDIRLLQLENTEHPNDPFTLFNLGMEYLDLDRPAEALPYLRHSLELSHPNDSIVRKLYAQLARCHRKLGQGRQALDACRMGRAFYPDDTELLFLESQVRYDQRDLHGAVVCSERLLRNPNGDGDHFASVDAALHGFKARSNLAVYYCGLGRFAEAEAQWQAAVAEKPTFVPAWLGLGDLYLTQSRWPEFTSLTDRMPQAAPQAVVEANTLKARGHLAPKQYVSAQAILEETIAMAPQAVLPREILTHVLLQEGKQWDKAEQSLRDLLELDPGNAEARKNLEALLRQKDAIPSISHR